jgi:hypothetical protein
VITATDPLFWGRHGDTIIANRLEGVTFASIAPQTGVCFDLTRSIFPTGRHRGGKWQQWEHRRSSDIFPPEMRPGPLLVIGAFDPM